MIMEFLSDKFLLDNILSDKIIWVGFSVNIYIDFKVEDWLY